MPADIEDIHHMRHALALAERGLGRVAPNPAVGCVIVKKGRVLATGHTANGGRPHAEAVALDKAGAAVKGATVYVTLEPCAVAGRAGPCAEALVKAGVKRVVMACVDPNPAVDGKGLSTLKNAGIDVDVGVLEKEAKQLNAGFFLKVIEGRPFITLKVAATADNIIAPASGGERWITGALARRHVHLERSRHDAILVGIGTVLADNPMLTTRLEGKNHKTIRIVLDSHLRIPPDAKLVADAANTPVWIFHGDDPANKAAKLEAAGVRLFAVAPEDVKAVARTLAGEGITRLLVEGGAEIHKSFARVGLGDRLLWYRAPQVLGEGLLAFAGMDPGQIQDILGLRRAGTRILGEDLLEIYEKEA